MNNETKILCCSVGAFIVGAVFGYNYCKKLVARGMKIVLRNHPETLDVFDASLDEYLKTRKGA